MEDFGEANHQRYDSVRPFTPDRLLSVVAAAGHCAATLGAADIWRTDHKSNIEQPADKNVFNYSVLIFAMALSYGTSDYIEGGVITAVIVLNVLIGFYQEFSA